MMGFIPLSADNAKYNVTTLPVNKDNFSRITYFSISSDGRFMYIADSNKYKIFRLELATDSLITLAGGSSGDNTDVSGTDAKFRGPYGVVVSPSGENLYVTCAFSNNIKKIVGVNTAKASGDVRVYTIAGQGSGTYVDNQNGAQATFNAPNNLVVSSDESILYVCDSGNKVIRKITGIKNATQPSHTYVSTIAGIGVAGGQTGLGNVAQFSSPFDIVITKDDSTLYIADSVTIVGAVNGNRIRKITGLTSTSTSTNVNVSTIAGTGDSDDNMDTVPVKGSLAKFNVLSGLCLSVDENTLYVSDNYNHKIKKITNVKSAVDGETTLVSTIAGTGTSGHSNGVGTTAEVTFPSGIKILDDDTMIYFLENYNLIRNIVSVE